MSFLDSAPQSAVRLSCAAVASPLVLSGERTPKALGPNANRAAALGCDRPEGCFTSEEMTMRLPYLRRNRAWLRHGGIDCRCCACWGWLVLGCGGGWGVPSCG